MGQRLLLNVFDAGSLGYAFEGECDGRSIVSHGRAELW
jgi:hypothetical protein